MSITVKQLRDFLSTIPEDTDVEILQEHLGGWKTKFTYTQWRLLTTADLVYDGRIEVIRFGNRTPPKSFLDNP